MVCYFVWRFFGTLKCEAERRPRSVGVALEFRFCEARCTFHHSDLKDPCPMANGVVEERAYLRSSLPC